MERARRNFNPAIQKILYKALDKKEISVDEAVLLFSVKDSGSEFNALLDVADSIREDEVGDIVTFVCNRNINFTNICVGNCLFCGFKKLVGEEGGFLLKTEDILNKVREACETGSTEVCIQGGLNPHVQPDYYIRLCAEIKTHFPDVHVHAFSPMEVFTAARRLGCSIKDYLTELKLAGLGSMPGTAAEILYDPVRKIICPHKLPTAKWIDIIKTAHELGLPTTATMMYGHLEEPWHRVQHLEIIRNIQKTTGGFTEFVPLSFVYPNTELYRQGLCGRGASGPTDLKVHAIARIMLQGYIKNIQVSWVKLGSKLAQLCLGAGGNDLGGTLVEENISRAAGSSSPEGMSVDHMVDLIANIGRIPVQRTTTYNKIARSYLERTNPALVDNQP